MVTPSDRALRRLIHRTIEFVVNYGAGFEVRMRRRRTGQCEKAPERALGRGWVGANRPRSSSASAASLPLPSWWTIR